MKSPRDLVGVELFDRLTERVMKEQGHDRDYAERVVDQAAVFLAACAGNPDGKLTPSSAVDAGWHAFILHTEEYAAFCGRVAGRFIHHDPVMNDDIRSGSARTRTIEALHATGYPVDMDLWPQSARCMNTCNHPCHDSGDDDD